MSEPPKNHTHTVYAYQRLGKKPGHLLEVGSGYIDRDRDIAHLFMNRQPIGGYTGYVVLSPRGMKPPPAAEMPTRGPEEHHVENEPDA